MRFGLAIMAAMVVLAGCGHATAAKDPLVGTWGVSQGDPVVVISKTGDKYTGTMVIPGYLPSEPPPFRLTRNGNVLTGTVQDRKGPNEMVFTYSPSTGKLVLAERGLLKLSDSTATATASP